jgi:hypothetical protein
VHAQVLRALLDFEFSGLYFLQKQYIDLRWWSVVAAALARLSIGCRACVFALRSDY